MQFPQRLTFEWLDRTIPSLTADEFDEVVRELDRRGWSPVGNFLGMLEVRLPAGVRREAVRRRNSRVAIARAAA